MNDIMVLSRLGAVKALNNSSYSGGSIKAIFITADKGLEDFLDSFTITYARSLENNILKRATTLTTVSPKRKLFPSLGREAFAALVGELNAPQILLEQSAAFEVM